MAIRRFQNKATQSRIALPMISLYGLLVWIAGGLLLGNLWMNFACFVISSYLMVELNNSNALIRTYSRSVSCSFIILSCAANFLFQSMQVAIIQLCVIASYLILFRSYQNKCGMPWMFYAFLCVGLGSMVFVHILYFVPLLWIVMTVCLRSMSVKNFIASLIGLSAPYWFSAGFYAVKGDISQWIDHFTILVQFHPLCNLFTVLPVNKLITFLCILLLVFTGIIHYMRTSYNDKIRVRMLFDAFITIDIFVIAFIFLQPAYFNVLLQLLIINTSPLIGHYATLTHTWITNISFVVIMLGMLLLTSYNLWAPSLTF